MTSFYIGPWRWESSLEPHWASPVGFAALDLRTLPMMEQQGGTPGLGLFWGSGVITDSEYTLVGQGSFYDIKPGRVARDRIPKRAGYTLKGDDLVGIILDLFTDGADPTGQESVKPLMPGMNGRCVLRCGFQSHNLRMRRGHGHWGIARDLLRGDLKRHILAGRTEAAELRALASAVNGLNWQQVANSNDPVILAHRRLLMWLRNRPLTVAGAVTFLGAMADRRERQYRKILDFTLGKYRIDKADWRDLCPQDIVDELDPPEPHDTTITESFNTTDSDTLGPDLTWTETAGDWDVVSNQASLVSGVPADARAEQDLSSDDQYAKVTAGTMQSAGLIGSCVRFSASARTYYCYRLGSSVSSNSLHKRVAGTFTNLANGGAASTGQEIKVDADGSSITGYANGSVAAGPVTDTAITGNTRTGIGGNANSTQTIDDFEAADLAADPGIIYTQLERDVRGVLRGVYTDQ